MVNREGALCGFCVFESVAPFLRWLRYDYFYKYCVAFEKVVFVTFYILDWSPQWFLSSPNPLRIGEFSTGEF